MEPVAIDWGYAISTLIIRFVGIFVVLGILQVVMQITGRIFARLDATGSEETPPVSKTAPKAITDEEVAAVAMALYLHQQKR